MKAKQLNTLKLLFSFALILNVATWLYAKNTQAKWVNVPPPPSYFSASFMTLGDSEFSYRIIGTMIQNFGSIGGRITPIKDYDFENLAAWFFLEQRLSPKANFAPMMAAFYYGASQDPTKIRPIIEYLRVAGNSPEGEKWRWLAHAVHLSRFKLKDYNLAYELAELLAKIPNPDMPVWTRQMTVNVKNDMGEKEAAMKMMLEILKSGQDTLHPAEINSSYFYICNQILDAEEASRHDFCKDRLK